MVWGTVAALHALAMIGTVASAFSLVDGSTAGLVSIIVAPLVTLLSLIAWRLLFEFLAVQFRQADLLEDLTSR